VAYEGSGLIHGVDVGDLAGSLLHREVAGRDPEAYKDAGDDQEDDDNVKKRTADNVLLHASRLLTAADD
jgi:hypothetical protein